MTIADFPRTKTTFTPDDLLELEGDAPLYELVNGKLVEKEMSALGSRTAGRITARFEAFFQANPVGQAFPEQTFQCFPSDEKLVRRPDVAVLLVNKLPMGQYPEGHLAIVPDIAIEVTSPNDKIRDLDDKLDDYRAAGIPLVWVVKPDRRSVEVSRLDKTRTVLEENDQLTGESVLPGFSVRVGDLFPPKV